MKKIKNQIISFNLTKCSFGLMVASAIAIAVIGVNSALAFISPNLSPSVSGGDGGGSVDSGDLAAKCSKLGKDHAGEDIGTVDDQDLLKECVSHGLCERGYYDSYTYGTNPKIKNCDKADELLDDIKKSSKTQKDYAAKMSRECAKYDGKPYDPKTMAQCVGPNGVCSQENNVMNCGGAKKTNVDNGYNPDGSGGPGASGGEGTKNPSRAEGPLSGDGIGSDPVGDFLGFPAWNRDVHFSPGSEIGPQVMKIVLNITEILLRLAGIAAVIVIIYAGAMFIIGSYSSSPDGIAKAKTILINGVIGLIIAIAATAIVSFIAGSLKGK